MIPECFLCVAKSFASAIVKAHMHRATIASGNP